MTPNPSLRVATSPGQPIPLPGVATLADRYDGFLMDLWGCVHDGLMAYPGAGSCLERLRARGCRVLLLSNAPRGPAAVARRLAEMGIDERHYDGIMTSGKATREALAEPPDAWHAGLGRLCYHLGPDRDRDVVDDHPRVAKVADPDQADFVLNTGPLSFEDPEDHYDPLLSRWAARGVPMVCANPDLVVVSGGRLVLCAGTLAKRYESMGGAVRQHGKPFPAIYQRCLRLLGIEDRGRILALGDGLHTDIAGGAAAGLDTAFLAGGIHRRDLGIDWGEQPSQAALEKLVRENGTPRPTWVLPALRW